MAEREGTAAGWFEKGFGKERDLEDLDAIV